MFRATLKSLMARKLRLLLSGLSVVLGVMFVSGSFVLTDTLDRSFDSLFSSVYTGVDAQVTTKPKVQGGDGDPESSAAALPASVLETVRGVDGVRAVVGDVVGPARAIGKNGKVLTTSGAPRLGDAWAEDLSGQRVLREGRAPEGDREVVLGGFLAKSGGFAVGDEVAVLTAAPKQTYEVVGVFGYQGGRDSLGGEMSISFSPATAHRVLLGGPDTYTSVTVQAADGVPQDVVRDRVAAAIGADYQVKTGTELAKAQTDSIGEGLKFFNYILLGFAGIALFVGAFIIFNTFSIIVAQRTKELALMRAMGASRRQMMVSVVLEALVIGVVASVVGLGAGVGVGALLARLFATFGGGSLQLASIGLPAAAVVSSFAVGILVTMAASVFPAVRASRIAPVAAMREAATPDRPLTKPTVAGAALSATGGTLLGIGLANGVLWMVFSGILVAFLGVALLTPLISKPVVAVIGGLLSWSTPGTLGRRNSARNPRRTAITAAALMVGIALITGVSIVLTSATASITKVADSQISADLIISGEEGATFEPAVLDRVRSTPGVESAFGFYSDYAAVDGDRMHLQAVTDFPAMQRLFGLRATAGSFADVTGRTVAMAEETAKAKNLGVGSTVTVQLAKGEQQTYSVAVIYAKNGVMDGVQLSAAAAADFSSAELTDAFAKVAAGTPVADVQHRVEPLFADNPEVSVQDRSAFVRQQAAQLDTVLLMVQILLALAILIAVLGVVNTLALSVVERTRELGMLRAIGMRRAQVMRMIIVESVVISVFGALLGLLVGSGLGVATVRALRDQGITELGFPWARMGTYLAVAAVIGVVAAILPAIRAARLNVLNAISYE
ncbi:ABC transporter permease [Umezawaea tangerina]|uniref:Putative ABC transport system permease protein n=1 Tax=Umezawaea tangerina TaxID=84725 RepID=A0A2T0SVI6_9PSEU|nr:FtsX-like permease family protein [Umezawaea tangerina]PRY37383.1 putative ABC transport system permease protein [Umezawaea tangerina]